MNDKIARPANGSYGTIDGVEITEEVTARLVRNAEDGFPGAKFRVPGHPTRTEELTRCAVRMNRTIGILRLALAALIIVAIAATYAETAIRIGSMPNPFNFFGYFTIQSNLLGAIALVIAGVLLLRGKSGPIWGNGFRCATVAYLLVVGIVYAVLLAPLGAEGGVPLPWANVVLHIVAPIAIVLDWLLAPDRPALPWKHFWLALIYPAAWITVVLIRGVTDGWVPYPFLAPENGAVSIAIVCAGIAATILVASLIATAMSRVQMTSRAHSTRGQGSVPA